MARAMLCSTIWRRPVLAAGAVLLAVAAGCSSSPTRLPVPPPDISVWMVGDSLSWGTAQEMNPRPYPVVSGGAGFTEYAFALVLDNVTQAIAQHGQPETMLVMAGVADTPKATTEESLAGMEEFDAAMTALGIRLIWVAEPGFSYATQLEPLSDWVLGHPESIDCRQFKGWTVDGVHPEDYNAMADCVNGALVDLGVQFTVPDPVP
jgi:hypothetical protein